jgi:hypothetical protein
MSLVIRSVWMSSMFGFLGCGSDPRDRSIDAAIDGLLADAFVDAAGPCTHDMPFGSPMLVDGISSSDDEHSFRPTADGLTAIVGKGVLTAGRLYIATRASTTVSFGSPTLIPGVVNGALAEYGQLSTDGLAIYFDSDRTGNFNIFKSTRPTTSDAFGTPAEITVLNTTDYEAHPYLTPDGAIYFYRSTTAGKQIRRSAPNGASFDVSTPLAGITSWAWPVVTPDELELFVAGNPHMFRATRASTSQPFSAPLMMAGFSGLNVAEPSHVSADNCELYFSSDRPDGAGGRDIWVAKRR